jgi:hypothetical protein
MIELLRETWHLFPDLRLTQLVIIASEIDDPVAVSGPLFCLEDDEMQKRMERLLAGRRRKLKAREDAA